MFERFITWFVELFTGKKTEVQVEETLQDFITRNKIQVEEIAVDDPVAVVVVGDVSVNTPATIEVVEVTDTEPTVEAVVVKKQPKPRKTKPSIKVVENLQLQAKAPVKSKQTKTPVKLAKKTPIAPITKIEYSDSSNKSPELGSLEHLALVAANPSE